MGLYKRPFTCAAILCIFASICSFAAHGSQIIIFALIAISAGMILLYSKKCLYRNRIVCGIFMAAVLIAAYLNGISHTTPITTDSYIKSYNKTQVEAEAVVISRTDKETYIQLILDRQSLY